MTTSNHKHNLAKANNNNNNKTINNNKETAMKAEIMNLHLIIMFISQNYELPTDKKGEVIMPKLQSVIPYIDYLLKFKFLKKEAKVELFNTSPITCLTLMTLIKSLGYKTFTVNGKTIKGKAPDYKLFEKMLRPWRKDIEKAFGDFDVNDVLSIAFDNAEDYRYDGKNMTEAEIQMTDADIHTAFPEEN